MRAPTFFRSISAAGLLIAALMPQGGIAWGQEDADEAGALPFSELKKRVAFDREPIKQKGPVVTSYADMLEGVMPGVVTIFSTKESEPVERSQMFNDPLFRRFFGLPEGELDMPPRRQQGLGSGVIISQDGYIITNNHVIEGADSIMVSLPTDRRDYEAEVIASDPQTDIALIKIESSNLNALTIGNSSALRVGDVTLAIGNPFGLEQTVTVGIVSALGRTSLNITGGGYENFIQTDASVNQGNSGGALVDAHGRVVGINTAIQSGMAGGNIGIAFAIPIDMTMDILKRLLDNDGTVRRGFLGVYLSELDSRRAKALGREDRSGAIIEEVGPDTPAADAGLKAGDLIIAFNGRPVDSMPRLRLDISNMAPGSEVEFDVVRKQQNMRVKVTLGDLEERSKLLGSADSPMRPKAPKTDDEEFLPGVRIRDIQEPLRQAAELPEDLQGAFVESVKNDSPAAEAGLAAGMVITQVDQGDIRNAKQAASKLESFKGDVILLQVYSEGRRSILAVPVKK